jgi:hypothetical protein
MTQGVISKNVPETSGVCSQLAWMTQQVISKNLPETGGVWSQFP